MTFAGTMKSLAFRIAASMGMFSLVLESEWRRQRLAILCYHGISTEDEHLCFPGFYMPPQMFEARLRHLRDRDFRLLPLDEALERLDAGTLPARSLVITIDDAFYGMYSAGRPILRAYGFPTTVYTTTYYVYYNVPVFDPMVEYLLWKASKHLLDWNEIICEPIILDDQTRRKAMAAIREYALRRGLSGHDKNDLLNELATRLGMDYQDLCRRRLMHIVNSEEIQEWSKEADIQLHSHRHRLSRDKDLFDEQIRKNEIALESLVGYRPTHFCYPAGMYLPHFPDWLREYGLKSAVSCDSGLATRRTDHMLLPRIMDTATLPLDHFDSWVTGASALIPMQRQAIGPDHFSQLIEDEQSLWKAQV